MDEKLNQVRLNLASKKLREMRENQILTDVMLKCKGGSIHAHRCVLMATNSFFYNIFCDNLTGDSGIQIEFEHWSVDVMVVVISTLYGDVPQTFKSLDQIINVLETSHLIEEMMLFNYCMNLLMQLLTIENCVHVWSLTVKYNQKKAETVVKQFMVDHLPQLLKSNRLADMSVDQMTEFVSFASKTVTVGDQLVSVVMQWGKRNQIQRLDKVIKLFNLLEKLVFSSERIHDLKDDCLIKSSPELMAYLTSAKNQIVVDAPVNSPEANDDPAASSNVESPASATSSESNRMTAFTEETTPDQPPLPAPRVFPASTPNGRMGGFSLPKVRTVSTISSGVSNRVQDSASRGSVSNGKLSSRKSKVHHRSSRSTSSTNNRVAGQSSDLIDRTLPPVPPVPPLSPRSQLQTGNRPSTPNDHPTSPKYRSGTPSSRSVTPNSRSVTPNSRSVTPNSRSVTPNSRSVTPNSRSVTPNNRSVTPNNRPVTPNNRPVTPGLVAVNSRPTTPSSRPTTPSSRPTTPSSRPTTPNSRPTTPISRPTTPNDRPTTPSGRPEIRAKSHQEIRTDRVKTPSGHQQSRSERTKTPNAHQDKRNERANTPSRSNNHPKTQIDRVASQSTISSRPTVNTRTTTHLVKIPNNRVASHATIITRPKTPNGRVSSHATITTSPGTTGHRGASHSTITTHPKTPNDFEGHPTTTNHTKTPGKQTTINRAKSSSRLKKSNHRIKFPSGRASVTVCRPLICRPQIPSPAASPDDRSSVTMSDRSGHYQQLTQQQAPKVVNKGRYAPSTSSAIPPSTTVSVRSGRISSSTISIPTEHGSSSNTSVDPNFSNYFDPTAQRFMCNKSLLDPGKPFAFDSKLDETDVKMTHYCKLQISSAAPKVGASNLSVATISPRHTKTPARSHSTSTTTFITDRASVTHFTGLKDVVSETSVVDANFQTYAKDTRIHFYGTNSLQHMDLQSQMYSMTKKKWTTVKEIRLSDKVASNWYPLNSIYGEQFYFAISREKKFVVFSAITGLTYTGPAVKFQSRVAGVVDGPFVYVWNYESIARFDTETYSWKGLSSNPHVFAGWSNLLASNGQLYFHATYPPAIYKYDFEKNEWELKKAFKETSNTKSIKCKCFQKLCKKKLYFIANERQLLTFDTEANAWSGKFLPEFESRVPLLMNCDESFIIFGDKHRNSHFFLYYPESNKLDFFENNQIMYNESFVTCDVTF